MLEKWNKEVEQDRTNKKFVPLRGGTRKKFVPLFDPSRSTLKKLKNIDGVRVYQP